MAISPAKKTIPLESAADPVARLEQWRQTQGSPILERPAAPLLDDARRGPTLGRELPAAVYISVIAAYAWLGLVAWVAFGRGASTDLELGIASVVVLIMLGLPAVIFHLAWTRAQTAPSSRYAEPPSRLDTATGELRAGEAWLQILIIPAALAFAATLIGIVYWIVV